MIRGEDVNRFADRASDVAAADGEPLRGQIFQASQAAQRLGQRVQVGFGLGQVSFRRRGDLADHFF